jgi:hypothetical protein
VVFRKERYPADWPRIREAILVRADDACETCRAPNGVVIVRGEVRDVGTYMLDDGEVRDAETGAVRGRARGSEYVGRYVRIILTVAHLDHDEANNDPSNLAALCQLHHLRHDRADNARRRRANTRAKCAAGTLPGVKA